MRNTKGIPEGEYICSLPVNNLKTAKEFHWYEQTIDGRGRGGNGKRKRVNGSCRECRNKLARETSKLKRKIIPLIPQPKYGELCEACNRPVNTDMQIKAIYQKELMVHTLGCYDHNHETVEFRGWICNPCNFLQ